jgi:hypothetical protein
VEHSRGKPSRRVDGTDGRYEVTVATDDYAYFVKRVVPADGTRFGDSYFDLFPGQQRVIEV